MFDLNTGNQIPPTAAGGAYADASAKSTVTITFKATSTLTKVVVTDDSAGALLASDLGATLPTLTPA